MTVSVGIFREDEALRDLVSGQGFEFGTTFQQMRLDHPGPIAVPDAPAGTTPRTGAYDDQTHRATHAVMTAAFIGQATSSPYDEWLADHENQSTFDWSQVTLVERDGQVLAAC
ncbi:hypothetical protein EV644_118149 [Kribbella orskensis]|uniref:Uncharacterized protein n=1 Tax=Kribbella orskensis TaxID=2512216 RepID=A0ABY2BCA5_9ACTN|nr:MULTISPECIES: hypothetical protein [Kribbella]TCN34899.1 hypothetical protein EV642_119148 [Kribbella sp. VKM Ac-2500]TCO15605.1 hypothetical protein EV644_118149 [Kribbella orskensis]